MASYDVFLHFKLLDGVPDSRSQRRRIIEFLRRLSEQPDTPGDYADKDASSRERQIKIVGEYAVTYWVDDPARAVMVVDICPAGR